MKKALFTTITASILALTISCNNDDNAGKEAEKPAASSQTQTPASSEIKDDVSQKNVVQVALGSKDHTTLVAALKQAELVDVLTKSGPFTVFAPTNAAFDKLPKGTLDDLMKPEKKEALQNILEYHVSVGIYKEDMLHDGQVLGQVNSGNIKITKKDNKIIVNGTANVVGSIMTSNGIIYIIDGVLLPPAK